MQIRIEVPIPPERGGGEYLRDILETMIRAWLPIYATTPLPPLYQSGVIYKPEPNSGEYEDFKSPHRTYLDRWGDCDDLVIYRCVELRARGEHATVQWMRAIGTGRMHVRVRRGSGAIEDPSIVLMRKAQAP